MKSEETITKIQKMLEDYWYAIDSFSNEDHLKYEFSHTKDKEGKRQFLKGLLLGILITYHERLWGLLGQVSERSLMNGFGIIPSRRQKDLYSYKETWVADGFTVELNKIYGIPVEKGKEYTTTYKPWLLIHVQDKWYPIFSDDPGQQDYIRTKNGTVYSFGAYNSDTIGTALYNIMNDIYNEALQRVQDFQK